MFEPSGLFLRELFNIETGDFRALFTLVTALLTAPVMDSIGLDVPPKLKILLFALLPVRLGRGISGIILTIDVCLLWIYVIPTIAKSMTSNISAKPEYSL